MQFGVTIPHAVRGSNEAVVEFAELADALGYTTLSISEHLVVPVEIESRYPYSADGKGYWDHEEPWPEAMVTLAFLAGITKNIRLATSVIPAITRDPLSLAKQAATVDLFSGGRHDLGLGAGWCLEEAEMLGHAADHPIGRLIETIEILHAAWTSSSFAHAGRFWNFAEVGVHPHPPQGGKLPIFIGGTGPRLLRAVAEHADGVIVAPGRIDRVAAIRAQLPSSAKIRASLPLPPGASVETMRTAVARLQEDGADQVTVWVARHGRADALATIETFARAVVPQFV